MFLNTAMSQDAKRGPMIVLRATSPKNPASGREKQLASKYCVAAEHRVVRTARHQARALTGAARPRQRARAIESKDRRDRNARAQRHDARHLPPRSNAVRHAGHRLAEGQLPRVVENEIVPDVEIREPFVVERIERVARLKAVVEVAAADGL